MFKDDKKEPIENPPKQESTKPTHNPQPITEGYDPDRKRD